MRKRLATITLLVSAGVTVWLWIVFAAAAQSLPKLNASAISNRMFGISWAYTNAGFTLQESGGLQTV